MARLCFDLDGTLCTATGGEYERAQPLPWAIARVNALARAGHRIIIFTARGTATGIDWSEVTRAQLDRWGVSYHELHFGKPSADVFIDDRAVHSESWCAGDAFRPPGLPTTAPPGASDLFADLPVSAPAPISVTEFGRTFGGRPMRLEQHAQRARDLARGVGIEPAPPAQEVVAAVQEGLASCHAEGDVVFAIQIIQAGHACLLGLGSEAGEPRVQVSCRPLQEPAGALTPLLVNGADLAARASRDPKTSAAWPLPEARGTVGSGLGARLGIAVDGGLVLEPSKGPADVAGAWLVETAQRLGLAATEQPLSAALVGRADEAFVVGFPFCLLALGEIDGRTLPAAPGPLTREILGAWGEEAGIDILAQTKALISPAPRSAPNTRSERPEAATIVIPARLHSTRLPEKVLADIGGRPMIEHVYRAAVEAACGPVLVLTDAEEVAEAVAGFGGEVWMTDPGHPSGTARIASVIERLKTDVVVNLQGDAPLIDPEVVAQAATEVRTSAAAVAMPVYPLQNEAAVQDPSVVKVVRAHDGRVLYCSRSVIPYSREANGAAPQGSFWGHAGLYAYTSDFLRSFPRLPASTLEETERLEQLRWLEAGVHIHSFVIRPQQPSVDTPQDLEQIRRVYESRLAL